MMRSQTMRLAAMILLAASPSFPVDAAAKYKPCTLLTSAEVEAALRIKVDRFADRDLTIPEGPFKGEVMSTCDWSSASAGVTLNVIRGPKNAQEQAAGLADIRAKQEDARKKGWTIESGNVSGAECFSMKPPASDPTAVPSSWCFMVSKGLAFSLGVVSKESASVEQAKTLADKVAARL